MTKRKGNETQVEDQALALAEAVLNPIRDDQEALGALMRLIKLLADHKGNLEHRDAADSVIRHLWEYVVDNDLALQAFLVASIK